MNDVDSILERINIIKDNLDFLSKSDKAIVIDTINKYISISYVDFYKTEMPFNVSYRKKVFTFKSLRTLIRNSFCFEPSDEYLLYDNLYKKYNKIYDIVHEKYGETIYYEGYNGGYYKKIIYEEKEELSKIERFALKLDNHIGWIIDKCELFSFEKDRKKLDELLEDFVPTLPNWILNSKEGSMLKNTGNKNGQHFVKTQINKLLANESVKLFLQEYPEYIKFLKKN